MLKDRRTELRTLDALLALVEERSVSRAAQRMGVTQPRMSGMLARLRRLFDDPLLVRGARGMVATERGREIAGLVQAGLAQIDGAAERAPFAPETTDRLFTLAMSEYISLLLAPRLMRQLGRDAPGLRIAVKVSDPVRIRDWLADGACDMAYGFFGNLGESLRSSILFEDEPICVASSLVPEGDGGLTLDAYCGRRHAVMGGAPVPVSTMEQMVDAALAQVGRSRQVSVRVPSLPALAEIVAQTDLLATLPRHLAGQLAARAPVRMVALPVWVPPVVITMVWHERSQRDAGHQWLRRQSRAIAKAAWSVG